MQPAATDRGDPNPAKIQTGARAPAPLADAAAIGAAKMPATLQSRRQEGDRGVEDFATVAAS